MGGKETVTINGSIRDIMKNGFGEKPEGEDPFDTFCGACGMIEVASGCRLPGAQAMKRFASTKAGF